MTQRPLLGIVIPTFNRARYLELTLRELASDIKRIAPGRVELIVSDNASTDDTREVLARSRASGLNMKVIRNSENIGSDANIAQAFNAASARYVLILGDDDILYDGVLSSLLDRLEGGTYGVVCLQPYGYADDFRAEYPGGRRADVTFDDPGAFLVKVGQYITLISAMVINKEALGGTDASAFEGGNLVQVHLALEAALRSPANLYVRRYSVACKRNNSGGYDFARVFVTELWAAVDQHAANRIAPAKLRAMERRFLVGFYPFYLFRQRLSGEGDLAAARRRFKSRFGKRLLYRLWLAPILLLPRPLAIAWGGATTLLGRVLYGDLWRGLTFGLHRLRRRRG